MRRKRVAEGAAAADKAWKAVPAKHPSRTLVERLILDEVAWSSLYEAWQQLVDKKVKWEDLLAALLAKDGADKVDERLRSVYGLTFCTAYALMALLERHMRGSSIFSVCDVTTDCYVSVDVAAGWPKD